MNVNLNVKDKQNWFAFGGSLQNNPKLITLSAEFSAPAPYGNLKSSFLMRKLTW